MATINKAVEVVDPTTGTEYTFTAIPFGVGNGIDFDNANQNARLVFRNTTAGAITITIKTDRTFSPNATGLVNKTFTLPANANGFEIPALANQWWAQASPSTSIIIETDVAGAEVALPVS